MIKRLKHIFVVFLLLSLSSCAEDKENRTCFPVSNHLDFENNTTYVKITLPDNGTQKGVMEWITDKVENILNDASENIYEEIATDGEFVSVLAMAITLSIMFYALAIMLGIAQASGYSFAMFVIKLVFVYNFAVNWQTFDFYVVQTFEAFVNDTVLFAAGIFHGYSPFGSDSNNAISIFSEIDTMISILWDFRMVEIALATFMTGSIGFFWGLLIIGWMWIYLFAMIFAVKTYLLAMIARYVLYALGPIFLTFLLFNQTRSLFDGYLEQLINFSIQPAFLFIFLGLFHMIMAGFANSLLVDVAVQGSGCVTPGGPGCGTYVGVTYGKIKELEGGKDLNWWKFCTCNQQNLPVNCEGAGLQTKTNINIWVLLTCIILSYLMYSMLSWVTLISSRLSAGIVTFNDVEPPGFDRLKKAGAETVKWGGGFIARSVGGK